MAIAFTFPGQGSQHVGMGKDLADAFPAAAEVFEEVDEILGQNLSKIMFEGPLDALTLTENTQPALLAVSVAIIRVLGESGVLLPGTVSHVAGHSLGEYSALVAAGAFSLGDAARLVKLRGQAMQQAVPVGEGAMAALLGLDFETATDVAADAAGGEICQAANDNAPGQVVISGAAAAIERAIIIAQDRGAKRAIRLPVSAPFHCALMAPAADTMAEALAATDIRPPQVPVVVNVLALPVSDPSDIRAHLVAQVTGTVRWRESIEWLAANGVDTLYEIGAGKVLSGLARRIDRGLKAVQVTSPDDVRQSIEVLGND